MGSIPGPGRCPGEGNGYPLRESCLRNLTGRRASQATVHGVTKTKPRLSNQTTITKERNSSPAKCLLWNHAATSSPQELQCFSSQETPNVDRAEGDHSHRGHAHVSPPSWSCMRLGAEQCVMAGSPATAARKGINSNWSLTRPCNMGSSGWASRRKDGSQEMRPRTLHRVRGRGKHRHSKHLVSDTVC